MEEKKITVGDILSVVEGVIEDNYIQVFNSNYDEMGLFKYDCVLLDDICDQPVRKLDAVCMNIQHRERPILVIILDDGGKKDE